MRLAVLTALAVLAFGCSHSATPQLAPKQPVVPLILQTGTPPLQWVQILTNEPTSNLITSVARDTHGNEWFAEYTPRAPGGIVGYVSQGRAVTEWMVASPYNIYIPAIVAGPDGNMWFTEQISTGYQSWEYEVGAINAAGSVRRYPQTTRVQDICNGPDGNLWVTTAEQNILRLTTAGAVTVFPTTSGFWSAYCHRGSDGRVWFADYQPSSTPGVAAVDPATGVITQYLLPASFQGRGLGKLALGSDGNIWSGDYVDIGKVTPAGVATVFWLPNGYRATAIVGGTDGNLWFAGDQGIGEWSIAGTLVRWRRDPLLVSQQAITSVSAGADGNMWVGTTSPAQINVFVRLVLTASPSPVVLTAGTSTTLTINETHYNGSFTVASSDPTVATVVNAGTRTTFTVTGISHGTTTLTIADKYQNSLVVTVNVN